MTSLSLSRRDFLGVAAGVAVTPATRLLASVAPRETVVTLLHTNDMHGHVYLPEKPQGLTRLATLVEQIRADMPNVLLLDAGDMIHGTPEERAFGGKPILSAMNALRYDVAAAGNHEFDFGQRNLHDALEFVKFPVLTANVRKTGTDTTSWGAFLPYKVFVKDSVRIGVFGLTTPTTVGIQWPRTLEGIRFDDPVPVAKEMVAHLRDREKVDVVIALSHLGYEPDKQMAAELSGVDVIIGGHSHTTLAKPVWVNGILIAQTGAYGKALGRVDILVRDTDGQKTITINGRDNHWWGVEDTLSPLKEKTFPSVPLLLPIETTAQFEESVRVYRPYRERMTQTLSEKLTSATEPLPADTITKVETPLGNLLADAVRAQAKADIAFIAGSQVNVAGLKAGDITVADLYTLMGAYTRQHIVTVRAPGAAVRSALDRIVASDTFPAHVSGVRRVEGTFAVGDKALLPEDSYVVAAPAHVIQDYLYEKPGVTVLEDDVLAPTLRDAAIAFLRGHAPLQNKTEKRLETGS